MQLNSTSSGKVVLPATNNAVVLKHILTKELSYSDKGLLLTFGDINSVNVPAFSSLDALLKGVNNSQSYFHVSVNDGHYKIDNALNKICFPIPCL